MTDDHLASAGRPIDTDELLATIGELYFQVRILQRMLAQSQAAAAPPVEQVNHAVREQ